MTNSTLPAGYPQLLDELKQAVRAAQLRAHTAVNTELLTLYWRIGRAILERQEADGWGTKVIDRLAADLRAEFPDMRGLSRRNLYYMRTFAAAVAEPIVQHPAARLPWAHVLVLLDKLQNQAELEWYAAAAVEHGWSREVLAHQIVTRLHRRIGAAPTNFADKLPAAESDLAEQLVRDPYVFDFLELTELSAERQLEAALMARLQNLLLELGHGFAFVGRQYHFDVDGDEFYIDLLFFNWVQSRFVVVELKVARFQPDYLGQLGFYVAWVDDRLRIAGQHAPTIGILLCAGRNDNVVRYSLASSSAPLAVADYTYDALPASVRDAVPSADQLVTAVDETLAEIGGPSTHSRAD